MSTDKKFEIPKIAREIFIKENIASKLPEEQREAVVNRVNKITKSYIGRDLDALLVMGYAAEKGKFEEFAAKLEVHFTESVKYVHQNSRQNSQVFDAVRANKFFVTCYTELGVQKKYV